MRNAVPQGRELSAKEKYGVLAKEIRSNLESLVYRRVKKIPYRRSAQAVDAAYESKSWKAVLDTKRWLECGDLTDYVSFSLPGERIAKVENRLVRVESSNYYAYRLQRLTEIMIQYAGDVTELVEAGCGWGLNLFSLSLARKWEHLYGYDISANGVEAARQAAIHFQEGSLTFDLLDLTDANDPNWERLRGHVVFTYYTLEQLKYDTAKVVGNLVRAGVRRVIHIEPTTELLRLWYPMDLLNYLYIKKLDLQDNLLRTLRRLETQKALRIIAAERLYYAPTLLHDGNLVVWEPTARANQ
ncbi:MAG: class I SAM-dependent methyltransferase [Chloroflexi bacterium]|nr:class I SAM-dependent methyltransferase [Chloroflexota bacterium]